MDSRRLVLNALAMSIYTYQHERLTPLIIFPDEVALFHDYKENDRGISIMKPEDRKKDFLAMLEEKLGRKVSNEEIHGHQNDKKFLKEAFSSWVSDLGLSYRGQSGQRLQSLPRAQERRSGAVRCELYFRR